MTRFLRAARPLTLLLVWLALLGWAAPASAQHIATTTTLSAAMTKSQVTMTVASATTFAANAFIWVDHELMQVLGSYSSGTVIPVRRGVRGSTTSHPNAAKVTVSVEAVNQIHFYSYDPPLKSACTIGVAEASVSPWINTSTGVVWVCRISGFWVGTNIAPIVMDSDQVYTP